MDVFSFSIGTVKVNSYLLVDERESLVIDPGYHPEALLSKISSLGLAPKAALLTHGHFDHIGGLSSFLSLPIYSSKRTLEIIGDPHISGFSFIDTAEEKQEFTAEQLDWHEISAELPLSFAGSEVKALSTPGHMEGSLCFFYKDLVFTGDTLFAETVGRTDLPAGDPKALRTSVIRLLESSNPELRVLPGHGRETTIRAEKASNPFYLRWKGAAS